MSVKKKKNNICQNSVAQFDYPRYFQKNKLLSTFFIWTDEEDNIGINLELIVRL